MSRHPPVKWAQRSDVLFITIDLPDAKDVKLKLEPEGKFYFSASSGPENIPYEVDIDLYDKVDVNLSKASIGSRNILYLVQKAESKWWSRLLKQEGKTPVFIKVDWDKWVDEDEQDEQNNYVYMSCGSQLDLLGMRVILISRILTLVVGKMIPILMPMTMMQETMMMMIVILKEKQRTKQHLLAVNLT